MAQTTTFFIYEEPVNNTAYDRAFELCTAKQQQQTVQPVNATNVNATLLRGARVSSMNDCVPSQFHRCFLYAARAEGREGEKKTWGRKPDFKEKKKPNTIPNTKLSLTTSAFVLKSQNLATKLKKFTENQLAHMIPGLFVLELHVLRNVCKTVYLHKNFILEA